MARGRSAAQLRKLRKKFGLGEFKRKARRKSKAKALSMKRRAIVRRSPASKAVKGGSGATYDIDRYPMPGVAQVGSHPQPGPPTPDKPQKPPSDHHP